MPVAPLPAGLSEPEAALRLAADGPNVLPAEAPQPLWRVAWGVLREPMRLLLLRAALVYAPLGERLEAGVLLGWVLAMVGVDTVQGRRTTRALEALRGLSSPRARVLRGGRARRIAGAEVVRGDLLLLAEGDRVPADALLREGDTLLCDESLLTGESVPVGKVPTGSASTAAPATPGGEGSARLWAGTVVVAGRGMAEVLATGPRSEMGRIGARLGGLVPERTPLQRDLDRVVHRIAILALGACVLLTLALGVQRGDWLQALLAGLALAMSALPEEFPMVLGVFYALGARRMAARNVLPRQPSAIEALGGATILCTDKTGTLTLNRMAVARLVAASGAEADPRSVPEGLHEVLEVAILASRADPFDPMEVALRQLGLSVFGADPMGPATHLHPEWTPLRAYPLAPGLPMVAYAWEGAAGARMAAAKGAPEAILGMCIGPTAALAERARALAETGLRVLAVATASVGAGEVPVDRAHLRWTPVGLVALEDPLRDDVPGAIAACRRAGIRVLVITGDSAATGRAIARQAGIAEAPGVLTGPEIDALDDGALVGRLGSVHVVARAVPEQKLRIVRALRAAGEVVAMTGDGVNDAPALRAADIGVAMGGRGTDVAREAAPLVLTDDAFGSLVAGVAEGRRIHDNLRRATAFILAVHVPAVGLSLLPVLTGWPLLLLPLHIAFLELVIDPACSFAFEAEPAAPDAMSRPPRPPGGSLFDRRRVLASTAHGAAVLVVAAGAFGVGRGLGDDVARGLAFAAVVAGSVALLHVSRQGPLRANPAAAILSVLSLAALGVVLYVPAVARIFAIGAPPIGWAIAAAGASVLAVVGSGRWVSLEATRPIRGG